MITNRIASRIGVLTVLSLSAAAIAVSPLSAQATERDSLSSAGLEANGTSSFPAVSGNGRYVVFRSDATNLVTGDTNGAIDIFVHDRVTRATTRVSVDSTGVEANDFSVEPAISADGRYVVFSSHATNLVPGDTNNDDDIFVHDRQNAATSMVSVSSLGAQGNGGSWYPSISDDGRYVAFFSEATNLVIGDTNAAYDVFVHDRTLATTIRVSVDSTMIEGNGDSWRPRISGDGLFVAFASDASNLVPLDLNGARDIFVRDLGLAATLRVSEGTGGIEANGLSDYPSISFDGRAIAFGSHANNLVPGDSNGQADVFVHDRFAVITTRESVDSAGTEGNDWSWNPSISGSGDFLAFASDATNLVVGDGNGFEDVFVRQISTSSTRRVSVSSTGAEGSGHSARPAISADGRFAVFDSMAPDLVPMDSNGWIDVFAHGPELTLEALPDTVSAGATLTFTTWRGPANGFVMLFATEVDGMAFTYRLATGRMGASGAWSRSYTVPDDPSLVGSTVGFTSFALGWSSGKARASNTARVSFE